MSELYYEEFGNGLVLRITDLSRRIAADRWLVRVEGTVTFADAGASGRMRAAFPGAGDDAWERLCAGPLLRWAGERNFIDEKEVEEVRGRLVDDFLSSARGYMADESFPERLVARRLDEIGEQLEMERRLAADSAGDDDGPADFSHLFR